MNENTMLNWGDIVKWDYDHWLNGTTTTRITKRGQYQGQVRHTARYWVRHSQQMCYVLFDGNKRASLVPLSEVVKL